MTDGRIGFFDAARLLLGSLRYFGDRAVDLDHLTD